jgi:Protein of unknown function (DUF2442)
MILHTTEVTHISDYRLFLRFNNGEAGEVNLEAELWGEVFEPLKDKTLFATAHQHPIMKTVAWDNGADIAPEYLLDLMRQQQRRTA